MEQLMSPCVLATTIISVSVQFCLVSFYPKSPQIFAYALAAVASFASFIVITGAWLVSPEVVLLANSWVVGEDAVPEDWTLLWGESAAAAPHIHRHTLALALAATLQARSCFCSAAD